MTVLKPISAADCCLLCHWMMKDLIFPSWHPNTLLLKKDGSERKKKREIISYQILKKPCVTFFLSSHFIGIPDLLKYSRITKLESHTN